MSDPTPKRKLEPAGWQVRPATVTPRLWRKFISLFENGCQFWTSQDGNAMEIVIVRRPDALRVLGDNFSTREVGNAKLQPGWVSYEWAECEFFDDPYEHAARRGKTWQLTDEPTPFPVLSWDPYRERIGKGGGK